MQKKHLSIGQGDKRKTDVGRGEITGSIVETVQSVILNFLLFSGMNTPYQYLNPAFHNTVIRSNW
jgi:hypothetical protein